MSNIKLYEFQLNVLKNSEKYERVAFFLDMGL